MDENGGLKGEPTALPAEGLAEDSARRTPLSLPELKLVLSGVRPRPELELGAGSPQADCLGLADPELDNFGSLEGLGSWSGLGGGKLI